jgi:hypothetical protein
VEGMSESDLYAAIILEATRLGHRLFRNNRGRARYRAKSGEVYTVPYGMAEGASDLIGWTNQYIFTGTDTSTIPPTSGYRVLPVFTAIEVKRPGGRTDKRRLEQQTRFIEAVKAVGGIAGFVTSVEDYRKLVGAE